MNPRAAQIAALLDLAPQFLTSTPHSMDVFIAALKAQHAGKMDFGKASGLVKAALAG